MKEFDKDLEIELKYNNCSRSFRYYYYRIKPKQLSFWDNLFHNHWKQLQHACGESWNPCIDPERYWDYISKLHTLDDVNKYLASEATKIIEYRNKLIETKLVFPY